MKKTLIIVWSLFICPTLFAQHKSGIVEYGITSVDVPVKDGNVPNDMVQSLIEIAKTQKFELKFNSASSGFNPVKSLSNEKYDVNLINLANIAYTTSEIYFVDVARKSLITKNDDNTLVKSTALKSSDWEISKETKKIDNYLCYKATYNFKYVARNNQIKTKTITAWFAPSLPFSYGPIEFHGLPGLILELNKDYTTYSAQKIVLQDNDIKIDFPKGKTITKEEYDKAVLKN